MTPEQEKIANLQKPLHKPLEPDRQPECLHNLLETQVRDTPDVVAVVFEGQHLTYAELDARANQLARHLRNLGVQRGTLVGIFAERSLEMIIALYATLKAGAAYVPIDPAYPAERVTFMLQDAQLPVLLTQDHLCHRVPPFRGHIVTLETDWAVIEKLPRTMLTGNETADDLAYMIYTSGSTGQPKGVMNTHGGICNRLLWMQGTYDLQADDRVLQKTPFSFDVSVWEFFWPLLTGARLVMARPGGHRDSDYLLDLIRREGITTVHFVPSMLQSFVREQAVETCGAVLRCVISSGEALSGDLQALFFKKLPAVALHNLYGPTEAAVDVTAWFCRPDLTATTVPIGRSITNIQIYLLDEHWQLVSVGQAGELHIGGVGLARGYHRCPDLTAEKFMPDPFGLSPGERLYKTGDLARYRPDGILDYLGRLDHQVKIRGFRIELGEIEAALAQHPAIRESVAGAWGNQPGTQRLVAYVVVATTDRPTTTDLLSWLKRTLPDYMLPSQFMFLEAIPLTPNGKVDRKALPPPDTQRPQLEAPYVSPTTPQELALAGIWSQALEVSPIGIHDNFFELGGDSIRAIQVLAHAQQQGMAFTLEQLFTHQTIHNLVQQLAQDQPPVIQIGRHEPFDLVSPKDRTRLPAGLEDAYPLTSLQMGMFYHNEKNPVSAIFHDIFTFRIQYPFQHEHLQLAVDRFVERHALMRTSFDLGSFTEPLQLVHPSARLLIAVEDLQHLDSTAQADALNAWITAEKRRPFDPTQAPLLRMLVHRYSTDEFQLIVSFHHVILDGWSLAVMLTEILQDYSSLLGGTTSLITPPAVSYRTYVASERAALAAEDSRQFWTEKLRDPDIHLLPRWPESYRAGGTEQMRSSEIPIPSEVFAGLKALALNAKVPLKSVLLAAHHRVMNALHGRPDVISGIITNGRPEEIDGERMVGLFLNTVPVRLRLNGGTWFELVQQMFLAELELIPHRRFPLADIQQALGGQRLFETAFDFVHFHVYRHLDGYKDMGFMEGHYFEANSFVLFTTFMMDVTSTQLQMHIDYDPAELCAEQVEAICGYYVNILSSMASQPHARYDTFSPLSHQERKQQLLDWNNTTRDYPTDKGLHVLFEEQVKRTPDAVALIDGIHSMSYTHLNQRANRLAHHLVAKGVGPDVPVAVCMARTADMLLALLAILKAGGAYVPLDPTYPSSWLATVLEEMQAPVLLTQRQWVSKLPTESLQVLLLDESTSFPSGGELLSNPPTMIHAEHLVYVLFTSGSTGQPKGVAITHRSAVSLISWGQEQFLPEELEGVLASTSICFDLSVFEIFLPLSYGGTVILAENTLAIPTLPAASQITLLNSVPSVMHELLHAQWLPSSIQVVNLAGEPLRTPLVQQLYAEPGIRKVYDLYGPSETTTYSTMALRQANGPETIGRPVTDEQIYLVELNQQLVPVGVAGELMIGGAGLARGYYRQPALTAEKFIPNGLSPHPGTRLYRTGDRGRYRPDGQIEYLGRFDHQVKVRGFRIEMGEIEARLHTHPTVEHAVVLCREDRQGDKMLVAYVVPSHTTRPFDVASIRAFLSTQLPDYMIPNSFVQLEGLPLTPNGKVDRKALPAPDAPRRAGAIATVLPRTPQEELMADIWRDVLQVDQIGVHDNFFKLGGHSLSAIRLISRVQQQWHLDISLKEFYANPTVARLGKELSAIGNEVGRLPLQPVSRSSPLPLSFSQQQLWLVDQLNPGSTAYTLPYAWHVTGPLRVEILEQSFNALIERHESLRMYIVEYEGEPRQAFLPHLSFALPVVDLQMIPQSEQEQACHARIREAESQIFDLKRGPLIRAALYRLAPDDHLLILTLHHMVTDGWSMDILFTELRHLYEAFGHGHSPTLASLPIQYADFAIWQRACLHEDELQRLLTYWTTRLTDTPTNFILPTDHPRPAIQTSRGGNLTRQMAPDMVRSLKRFCQPEGVTMFMTLLAVLQALLARHSGQEDIVVGTPVAHRHRIELEGIVGLFLNTLVLRTDLSGMPTFRQLLSRVKETCIGAYAHQELPFEKLVEALHPVRDLSRTPLFQVFFNLVDVTDRRLTLPGLTMQTVMSQEENSAKFDLTLYVFLTGDRAWLTWNYNTDLFNTTTIAWLFDHFETLLKGLLHNPDAPISTVSVFEDGGQSFPHSTLPVVVPSLPTFSPFQNLEGDLSLSKRFEQIVACYPQHMAIHTSETSWTYAELNRQANRVAHTLLNVLPDQTTPVPVGLLCTPGAPMLAGLLGILKTGHPYVPLEPSLPMGRLQNIASDATITIILCSPGTMEHADSLGQLGYQIIALDDQYLVQEESNIPATVSPNALAYILYTSGTTGVPKGVLQTHRNVLQHIRIYTNNLKIGPHDRLTLLASFSFDAAVMDIFGALLNGATLCPLNLQETDPENMSAWLTHQAITFYHSTPTVYRYWMKHLKPGTTFPALRLVVLGGEEATRADFEAYHQHLGSDCFIVNGLGPTESTISLQFIASHDTVLLGPSVPVGFPVADTEVILLDAAGQRTEIYGEIAIRSRHIALGYWQRPELTQRAFSGPPYPDGVRQYRTGDLGRYRPDGTLEFRGRTDTQIKLRGYRIELREIEAALHKHPAIHQAVVLCQTNTPGENQLVGYVVPAMEMTLNVSTLRTSLKTQLPEYMLPSVFVRLDALPFTSNGKIDRKALLRLTPTNVSKKSYVAPRTEDEVGLTEIWEKVLGRERIGAQDNFFELGGHSLLAIQVVGQIRSRLKINLSLSALFQHPTISQIAQLVKDKHVPTEPFIGLPLVPRKNKAQLPLSFSQARFWFLDQFEAGSAAYLLPRAFQLNGPLDQAALHASLNALVHRHESLRTTFSVAEGTPYQTIAPALTISLPVFDLQHLREDERKIVIHQHIKKEAATRFDLIQGPLIRASLLQIDPLNYVFLLTLHHIITDGWSNGILIRELGMFYRAYCEGETIELPSLPIQYADYSEWQRHNVQGPQLEQALTYWTHQLADLPILTLPTDRPRPPQQTYSSATHSFVLSTSLTNGLKNLSNSEDCTLFMTLLAAFQILLYRYTGQEDVVVGSPIAGRIQAELEGVVGLFMNTLVLRTTISGNPSFQEVLRNVRMMTLEAYEHEIIPFEQLLKVIKLERNLSYPPMFQVLFVLQNFSESDLELTGLSVSPLETDHADGMVDLSLDITERDGELKSRVNYNTDLFDPGTIQRLFGHFETLLQSLATDPRQLVTDLPLLTDPERHQLLVEWNATTKHYPEDQCLHELVEAQVERTPQKVAIVCNGKTLTYRELNQKANELAQRLQTHRVGRGHVIPVLMERGIDLVIAYLAVMKIGAAFSPLDPDWPQERLTEILVQLDSPVVLVGPNSSLFPDLMDWSFMVVDAHQLLTSGENLHIPMTLDDPIYVIFTSGSTGKPKGAINQHRGIVNRFFNMNDRYQCGPEDTILLTSHHIFDSSVWQIFWPLINGARTVIPLPTQGFDFTLIVDLIDQESVTIADFVPSVFQLLLDYITNIPNAQHILRSLRQLIIGGEAMQAAPIWQFMSMFPGVGISNAYGPTETSIGVIFFEVYEKCPDPIPIGRPLHNVYTVILDSHLHPVPIGIAGDLYVGGVCVGLGYLKNQEATDLVFITNPFPEISSKKLYKTGDKAKFLPDGNIQFLGRTDHQVKIRGIRIELGEIERALAEHPDVKDCVVLAQQDQQGDKYLIAYVVPRQQATLTPHDLSHFLKKKLPSSMVPSSYMLLEAFPLTAGGKLHLQALPIPDQSHRVQSATYVPPRTPLEELIGEIWRGLLKIDRISVHENFFELGGHSLLATQVLSRVRTLTHTEVSLRTLFDCPTIAQLANSLEGLRSQNEDEQTPPLRPQNHAGPIPLSFAQERLWFLAQLDPENTAYLMSSSFHLRGALRIPILEASLQLLVQRHAALRTTFKLEQDVPVQIISPEVTVSLSLLDLQSFAATEQSQEVDRILHEEAHLPFDLTIGPLFRFRVFNLAAENHIFLVTLHHIISDGWSMGVFLRELTTAYAALVAKELPSLPELPIQYADYAVWQRDYLQGTELEGQLAYWREQLQAPLTPLALPTDYPRPALQTSRGGNLTRHLAPEILQSLKTFCQAESVTMFMTLLAVLQALLARHSGQEDIVVGTPVAHRNRLELEGIVGLFLNTLVLRTDLSGMPTFRQLLSRVREVCLGAYAQQELPFEKLVEALQPVRDLSRTPLFQVFFNLNNVTDERLTLPGLTLQSVMNKEENSAKFDLTLYVFLSADRAWLTWNYNTDLFHQTTIAWLIDHYEALLEGLLHNPDAPISTVSVFGDAGQSFPHSTLPVVIPSLPSFCPFQDLDHDLSLAGRFEQMVARDPDHLAVHTAETSWTYAELNRQANRVAHMLLNVLPDQTTPVPVGLLCTPGAPMLAGLLGVLKTGHPYVPLEPTLPLDRLETIAADATLTTILCSSSTLEHVSSLRLRGYQIIPIDEEHLAPEETNPQIAVSLDALAYVLYTSGTTGVPKGVVQTHRNVLHHIRVYTNNLQIGPQDRLTQLASYSFDAAVMDIFGALLNGATLYPINLQETGLEEISPWLEQHAITIYHSTPTVYRYWLKNLRPEASLPSLRLVVLGGEEATRADFEAYQRQLGPDCFFVNGLGPTESTVSLQFVASHATHLLGQTVPVGFPVQDTEIILLDEEGQVTEVYGEIVLRSRYVALGYWQRPELTQHAFSGPTYPDGVRQYRTGDLGRYRPDGTLEFRGRKDTQVKLRGYRIELGEIESVLSQHPAVQNTAVLCREDTPGEKQLVAYVIPASEASLEPATLRTYLQTKLPDYMLPAAFVVLDAFPLTPNGKVNFRALPEPDQTHRVQATVYVSPRTPLEDLLAEMWKDLLKLDQIGVHDNFFALGGHSLLATQVVARLRHVLELDLPLRTLFEHPTVAQLANEIDTQLANTFPDWPKDGAG